MEPDIRRQANRPVMELRDGLRNAALLLALLCICTLAAQAVDLMTARRAPANTQAKQKAGASQASGGQVLRNLYDPCLGLHWQLQTDADHPGGPRRMVLVNAPSQTLESAQPFTGGLAQLPEPERARLSAPGVYAIRAGDRITVEQDSERVHGRFQAVALQSAMAGEEMRVRLASQRTPDLTSPVINVVVTAPGTARWVQAERSAR